MDMPKLRVVRRHSRGNLFVRLPRECVERLRALVDGPTAADFLPLSVQLPDSGETLYLSYNGGDIETRSDKSTDEGKHETCQESAGCKEEEEEGSWRVHTHTQVDE